MLKRLIENWLTNISEREFDIPFRLLLEVEGHVAIGHSTIHGPMELGKDIVSHYPDKEQFYFFQLKAGNASLNNWNEMERQIRQMVEVPYTHPNYAVGDPYQPVWVCTGQLDETVRISLGLKNDEYRRIDKPHIEVWDRNILIDKYERAFFDMLFVEDYFLIEYMRVWSHASDYLTDEKNLREFFANYLSQYPQVSARKAKRYIATYALLLSQVSHRYIYHGDRYSAIDCMVLGITQLHECILKNNVDEQIYKKCYSILIELVTFNLQTLLDELVEHPNVIKDMLVTSSSMSEIFELPLRTHSLASKIVLLAIMKTLKNIDNREENLILKTLIEHNLPSFVNVLSERQMGTYWLTIIGLINAGEIELAQTCIKNTFHWTLSFHGEDGLQGLPDPYQTYSIIPYHHLWIEPENARLIDMNGQSYLLPILLKFITMLDCRDDVASEWNLLSHLIIREVRLPNPKEFFAYRAEKAATISYTFPITGSWTKIQDHFTQRLPIDFDELLTKYPEALLFLTLAYPWRTQWRETERYT